MDWINLVVFPIIVGGVVLYLQSRIETIRREREKLQDERRKIYVDVLEPYIRMFASINNPSEAEKALSQITSFKYRRTCVDLNMMGSDDVVRAMNRFMEYFYTLEKENVSPNPKDMLVHWGGVLLAIRRDLGNEKTKLTELDMLRSQISDIDQLEDIDQRSDDPETEEAD